jgi:hypothetical protein
MVYAVVESCQQAGVVVVQIILCTDVLEVLEVLNVLKAPGTGFTTAWWCTDAGC